MKNTLWAILAVLVIGGGAFWLWQKSTGGGEVACTLEAKICPDGSSVGRVGPYCQFAPCPSAALGYKNSTYTVDGTPITLVNGRAEAPAAPGSASKKVTQYFGNNATGDLNGDGVPDAAFILTQSGGGSGTFYYVAAAIKTVDGGYEGTTAYLLGDRIAPQTTQIQNGEIVANYADRNPGEPMTARPSAGKTKYLVLDGTTLKESPRVVGEGERCGGNMAIAPVCKDGYHCAPVPGSQLPFGDVGGVCVKN